MVRRMWIWVSPALAEENEAGQVTSPLGARGHCESPLCRVLEDLVRPRRGLAHRGRSTKITYDLSSTSLCPGRMSWVGSSPLWTFYDYGD